MHELCSFRRWRLFSVIDIPHTQSRPLSLSPPVSLALTVPCSCSLSRAHYLSHSRARERSRSFYFCLGCLLSFPLSRSFARAFSLKLSFSVALSPPRQLFSVFVTHCSLVAGSLSPHTLSFLLQSHCFCLLSRVHIFSFSLSSIPTPSAVLLSSPSPVLSVSVSVVFFRSRSRSPLCALFCSSVTFPVLS